MFPISIWLALSFAVWSPHARAYNENFSRDKAVGVINPKLRDFRFAIPTHWCVVQPMRKALRASTRTRKATRLVAPRLLLLVTLLAFSTQTYLTQTHIHWLSERQISVTQAHDHFVGRDFARGTPNDHKDGYPANEDPANCPLCQELIHAGQFVTPAAAALSLSFISISVIEVAVSSATLVRTVTHIWRGRAPPLG